MRLSLMGDEISRNLTAFRELKLSHFGIDSLQHMVAYVPNELTEAEWISMGQ